MITQRTLEMKAKQFAQEYWGLDYNLPITINGRLTRALGRYRWRKNSGGGFGHGLKIEISKDLATKYKEEYLDSVLKHELTHWALSIQGRPFKDGHPVFEAELRRVGAHSTEVIPQVGEFHQGCCSKCGKVVVEKRTYGYLKKYLNNPRYGHGICGFAQIVYKGTRQVGQEVAAQPKVRQTSNPIPTKQAVAIQSAPSHIANIIQPGPRGVTNKQMIPVMQKAVEVESREILELLKKHYPTVFEGSIRYIGKSYQAKFYKLMGI